MAEPSETKVCPDCAETIKAQARVCRYCGHRFDRWRYKGFVLSWWVGGACAVIVGAFLLIFFLVLGSSPSASRSGAKSFPVRIFFQSDATRAQEALVGTRLRHEACVERVIFVSKAVAQRRMKKKFPSLYQRPLPSNPLPDSFTVVPVAASCSQRIGRHVVNAHWAGVETVRWTSRQ